MSFELVRQMVIGPFLAKSEAPENSSKGGPNLGEMMKCSGLSFLRGNAKKFLEGKIHRSEGLIDSILRILNHTEHQLLHMWNGKPAELVLRLVLSLSHFYSLLRKAITLLFGVMDI